MIYTTLSKIREQEPCSSGWKKLLTRLKKTEADDEPLSIETILESNGLNDALWCLRACDGIEKEARLYAVACARRVQHLMNDQQSIDALDVAERYANGEATDDELISAWESAWDAANAANATWDAASYAASYAANAANAAWAAGAAANAAWDAANAAWAAAMDAETDWQETKFRCVFCS